MYRLPVQNVNHVVPDIREKKRQRGDSRGFIYCWANPFLICNVPVSLCTDIFGQRTFIVSILGALGLSQLRLYLKDPSKRA